MEILRDVGGHFDLLILWWFAGKLTRTIFLLGFQQSFLVSPLNPLLLSW